jgi:hypothetical protein
VSFSIDNWLFSYLIALWNNHAVKLVPFPFRPFRWWCELVRHVLW